MASSSTKQSRRKTQEERNSKTLQVATRRQTRSMSTHDSKLDSSFSVSKPRIAKAEADCLPKKKSEAGAKSRSQSKSKSRLLKEEAKTEPEPDASSISDSKAEAGVHVKLEAPVVAVIVPTPAHVTTRKRKRTHTVSSHAIDPVYKYSNKQIAGVTSIQTYGEPSGGGRRWRYINSEYQLPVQKVHPDEGRQEGRESGDSRDEVILIQNQLSHSLYALIVQAILWNQTAGRQARPVLDELLARYPDPKTLAEADVDELATLLYPIGLYNSRARRLIDMANTWVKQPPLPGRGYAKVRDRKYTDLPLPDLEDLEDLEDTERNAQEADGEQVVNVKPQISAELQIDEAHRRASSGFWEIAHLPGIGPYALDSFRIFHRDEMRGLAADWLGKGAGPGFEPEWKRVVAADKDLRAYLRYLWAAEGWDWDVVTGKRKKIVKQDVV